MALTGYSVNTSKWSQQIVNAIFLPSEAMAKGAYAQDLLKYSQWKDVGVQLDGLLSKRVDYLPEAASSVAN
jgi:hypothetical protein